MLPSRQIRAFADELQKIALAKEANLPMQPVQPKQQASTPTGMVEIKPKAPLKKGVLSTSPPAYSRVHSVPTPSPMAGYQPASAAPVVKT